MSSYLLTVTGAFNANFPTTLRPLRRGRPWLVHLERAGGECVRVECRHRTANRCRAVMPGYGTTKIISPEGALIPAAFAARTRM